MSTATMTSKGQVTVPKAVRERLRVRTGDRLRFVEVQEGVFQITAVTRDVKDLKGLVAKPKKAVTVDEMNRAIAEAAGSR